MPRTADPTDIPERLLAAGLELFLRQGYNATGVQQLTDHAGVPKGSFYNHFASKEAYAAAIVERYEQQMLRSWERMMASAPQAPLAAIRHVFAQMVSYHERSDCPAGCLIGNFAAEIALTSDACRQNLLAAQLGWRQRLAGLVAAAQASGEIRNDIDATALSALTWAAWEGALLRMKVERTTAPLRESITLIFDQLAQAPLTPTPSRKAR
ncbi:MAG TPA: TetR family transcriptional regulator C-terminal domain-containing protein [Rhizobacter sp.]|nr:TetR family transcriptional regulator C-terminal domain-containing protein [Rhizobacter sp.]